MSTLNKNEAPKSIIDRITDVDAALTIAGTSINELALRGYNKDTLAYEVIKATIKVINDGWVADYNNNSQPKFEPRFIYKSGFGLTCDGYAYWGLWLRMSALALFMKAMKRWYMV